MTDIKILREQIDAIDTKLIALFEERMNVSKGVAEYKAANHLPTLNSAREKQVIEKAVSRLKNPAFAPYTEKLYHTLMDLSKQYQKTLGETNKTIGYQGVEGSFSYEACQSFLQEEAGNEYAMRSYTTFDALCLGLLNDEISCAVIPYDNSSTGPVIDVYDLLLRYDYRIIGEVCVKVDQNLLAKENTRLEDIAEVYSHPQAFMQSKEFLEQYSFKEIPYQNTAISAKLVSESDRSDIGCIASLTAAKLYHLKVLSHSINYNSNNYTKFIVLSKSENKTAESDKISFVLKLGNKTGELYRILKIFSERKINMVKIESRPDVDNPFEYYFFMDIDGNIAEVSITDALKEIQSGSKYYKYMGNYKAYKLQR